MRPPCTKPKRPWESPSIVSDTKGSTFVVENEYLSEMARMLDFGSLKRQQAMLLEMFGDLLSRSKNVNSRA